jgi:hypothetical protein
MYLGIISYFLPLEICCVLPWTMGRTGEEKIVKLGHYLGTITDLTHSKLQKMTSITLWSKTGCSTRNSEKLSDWIVKSQTQFLCCRLGWQGYFTKFESWDSTSPVAHCDFWVADKCLIHSTTKTSWYVAWNHWLVSRMASRKVSTHFSLSVIRGPPAECIYANTLIAVLYTRCL